MSVPDPIRPTIAQVGALLRARTKDTEGVEQGTFTPNTRPTDTEAQAMIDLAVDLIHVAVGPIPTDSTCAVGATAVGALGAACLIEKSYFPEQIASARSAYEQYWDEYQSALNGLARCLGVTTGNGTGTASMEWGQVPVALAPFVDDCGCRRQLPEYRTLTEALRHTRT